MRAFIFYLMSCFLFSNIANAAMLCCLGNIDAPSHHTTLEHSPTLTATQSSASPSSCHGVEASDPNTQFSESDGVEKRMASPDSANDHSCECDVCFQKNISPLTLLVLDNTVAVTEFYYSASVLGLDPEPFYTPPKPVS